jgi:phage gp36-like protein
VLQTYQELNQLHERGPLDREVVRQALTSMQAVIEQWVDGRLRAGRRREARAVPEPAEVREASVLCSRAPTR